MKNAILFLLAACCAAAQTNAASHVWHQNQKEVAGDYVSSGTTSLVIKVNGTNYFIALTALNDDDRQFLKAIKLGERKRQLEAEAQRMRQAGWVEFSGKMIENFPEKIPDQQKGWMDVTFEYFSDAHIAFKEMELGVTVRDETGDLFSRCEIMRQLSRPGDTPMVQNPLIDSAATLKRGDKIRLIGHCYPSTESGLFNENSTFNFKNLCIDSIEMIESADEAAADKKMKGSWKNPTVLDPDTGLPK